MCCAPISWLRLSLVTKRTPSTSALGPPQALFRGLQKQLCLHWHPKQGIHTAFPPPGTSHSTADMQLAPCSRVVAQFRSKAPKYCHRSLLPARDTKNTLSQGENQSRTLSYSRKREQQDSWLSTWRMPPGCPSPRVQGPTHIPWMFLCSSPWGLLVLDFFFFFATESPQSSPEWSEWFTFKPWSELKADLQCNGSSFPPGSASRAAAEQLPRSISGSASAGAIPAAGTALSPSGMC